METRKTLLFATLTLSGALLVGCGEDEPAPEESTQTEQESISASGVDTQMTDGTDMSIEGGENTIDDTPDSATSSGETSGGTSGAAVGSHETTSVSGSEGNTSNQSGSTSNNTSTTPNNTQAQNSGQTMPENPAADNEPNRDAPNPPDVESGTNINTGTGNDNMPEPASEATDETTQNQQSGQ